MISTTIVFFIFVFCVACPVVEEQNEAANHQGKEMKIIQLEYVGYLRDIRKLDSILHFLHCNKTISLEQAASQFDDFVTRTRNARQTLPLQDIRFNCQKQQQEIKTQKNSCWLCRKQFKNETYLAIHYTTRHFPLLPQPPKSQLSQILHQQIYKLLTSNSLRILLHSSAPHKKIKSLCSSIFQKVFSAYRDAAIVDGVIDRYGAYLRKQESKEICMIIAWKMGESTAWDAVVRNVSLIFGTVFGAIVVGRGIWILVEVRNWGMGSRRI